MLTTTTHEAQWDASQSMYVCRTLEVWSSDGDTWHDDYGGHASASEAFEAATIRLVGGPRDGEIVSCTTTTTATQLVREWAAQGYDFIGHGDGHSWYPCRHADIPRGARGVYLRLSSDEAERAIRDGLDAGWTY